ncbi:hypothetical protein D020_3295A, partial [Vibrio parahaemolyticus SBR10290]
MRCPYWLAGKTP